MNELTVHLTQSNREIAKQVMRRIAIRADKAMKAMAIGGRSVLKSVVQQAILDTDEMESLRGGSYKDS